VDPEPEEDPDKDPDREEPDPDPEMDATDEPMARLLPLTPLTGRAPPELVSMGDPPSVEDTLPIAEVVGAADPPPVMRGTEDAPEETTTADDPTGEVVDDRPCTGTMLDTVATTAGTAEVVDGWA